MTPLSTSALTRVVEHLPVPVALVDRHGFALAASPAALAALGLDVLPEDFHLAEHLVLSIDGTLTAAGRSSVETDDGEPFELVSLATPSPLPPKDVAALAGAVAHDFNNLLGVIMNFASLAAATVQPGSAAASDLREVLTATQRAATIAQRLQELGDVRPPGRFTEPAE